MKKERGTIKMVCFYELTKKDEICPHKIDN